MSNPPLNRRAVIVLGDSHSGVFHGLTYVHEETRTEFVGVAANIHGHAAAGAITADDRKSFNPELIRKLQDARRAAQEISAQPPLIVLALGGSDYVVESTDATWQIYDFILPEVPALVNRTQRCIPYELAKGWLERRLALYEKAFDLFEDEEVEIAAVVPPPPAHRSNKKFHALLLVLNERHLVAPFPIRGKLAWMASRYLANLARHRGVAFIDTWPIIADGLFLRPQYEFDGLHVSRAGGQVLMQTISTVLSEACAIAS